MIISMMGTADTVVAAPTEAVVFMDESNNNTKVVETIRSAGLQNLGNTCFLNSTIQCIRNMPEIRVALGRLQRNSSNAFICALRDELIQADASRDSIPPAEFVQLLRTMYPDFDQRSRTGHHIQHDAEEFYNIVVQQLQSCLGDNVKNHLKIDIDQVDTCTETDQESSVASREQMSKIVCNITGAVNFLHEGMKLYLESSITKHSGVLGRDAVWQRKQYFASLPQYLCFQFMRFFYKPPNPSVRDDQGTNCKILRAVKFPGVFDAFEYCNEELKTKLRLNREKEDKVIEESIGKKSKLDVTPAAPSGDAMVVDDGEMTDELRAAIALSLGDSVAPAETVFKAPSEVAETDSSFEMYGLPRNFTGHYELHSIVSHKGRGSDSGHYVGWVRQKPGSDYWWKYDDDKVSETSTDKIMELCGGGDRDMAYLAFYRFREPRQA